VTNSGEDSQLDLMDEAYLAARQIGISERVLVFLACTYAEQLFQLLVLLSPYGGIAAGITWVGDAILTGIGRLLLRGWVPT
jgi:hypothetical protein